MTTPETLDPETIARCRARLDYCRRSDNGYEVREGEFWAPLLLAYDASQDIAAHAYRQWQGLEVRVKQLEERLRLSAAAAETEAMFADELNAHIAELKAEVDRLQALLRASAERIAGQSELLSQRAEVKA